MLTKKVRGIAALICAVTGLSAIIVRPFVPAPLLLRLFLDSFLPWTGVLIVVALALAISALALRAIAVSLVSVGVWALVFVPQVLPLGGGAAVSTPQLTVATQNIGTDTGATASILNTVTAAAPDVIALEEVTDTMAPTITARLADDGYAYSSVIGTVGIWSRDRLTNITPVTLAQGWKRAMRVDVQTGGGPVRLYVVHAMSIFVGGHAQRDAMLHTLTGLVAADTSDRIIVAGDFNATTRDQAMAQLMAVVTEPPLTGGGFGFTWPSGFPMTRPDHILLHGVTATTHVILGAAGSDHRGVVVAVTY